MSTPTTMARAMPRRRAGWLSARRFVAGVWLMGAGVAALPFAAASGDIAVTESLPVLLQRGSEAFAAGNYAAAAVAFSQVEREFGGEDAWKSGTLPKRLLPLRGFAELRAGLPGDASESLAAFLERFPDDSGQRSFVLYSLALALRQTGRLEEALERFSAFESENADSAQAALAGFQRAEILFELGRPDEALEVLRSLSGNIGVSESLRVQARLRALQKAVELGQNEAAERLLFDEPWEVSTMPEIAVLAFAAMEMGDRFVAGERAPEAIDAYRFVLPKQRLVDAQTKRLEELKAVFSERAPSVSSEAGSFWIDFYRGRISRIEAQLRGLIDSEDYTVPLHMRIGQAYLLAGRHREAWLFFESIAMRDELPEALKRPAHYRWILAAAGLERWEDALTIARSYVEKYPDSDQAPDAFFLIARAHLEQHRYAEADEVLTDLLERFSDPASSGRALFTRGWVRTMLEQFEAARDDFRHYALDHPDGPLGVNAGLWLGLTYFFERDHAEAIATFDRLCESHPGHPLYPELLYRRGATLYAMRDLPRAREEMTAFVRAYRSHPRHTEALVLLGDILMGAGELDRARSAFEEVDPEAVSSFVYATFQIGKILRAREDYAGMVDHFTGYAGRAVPPALPRISEALHWVGWAEEQRGEPVRALPVYLDVLERFGDDPEAGEVEATLGALERLVRRINGKSAPPTIDSRAEPLLGADFNDWVDEERARALEEERFTRYARFTVYRADRHGRSRQPHQEEALLLAVAGTAPLEALDPTALARVGLVLQEIGSDEASVTFHALLDRFPASFQRAAAYYGLAQTAVKERSFDEAFGWLRKFDEETPTHPLAPRAALLQAQALERSGKVGEAVGAYEDMLRLKSARGRPHAEALFGLARCSERELKPEKAIAYHQRVYNMYRAYPDLVADAYMESARLFEELGDLRAASNTYTELLATTGVGDPGLRQMARIALERLEPHLTTDAPASTTAAAAPHTQ